ncbi:MAG: hypothetical protein DI636_01970 [Pelagerythrobacter marensis]|nr:MAG: hypothetical protein DI636_01970 [Pelagerythrobacter marensis]
MGADRPVRGPAQHLRRALNALAHNHTRHRIALRYAGDEAVAGGEHLIAELSDHEFTVPGQLVASAEVIAAEHTMLPAPALTVTCELLLLEDA